MNEENIQNDDVQDGPEVTPQKPVTPPSGFDGLPSLPLEEYDIPEAEEEVVVNTTAGATDYAIIGAGQCGGRLAKAFYDSGYKKAVAVNAAEQDLAPLDLPESHKLHMDMGASGAGKDMTKGEAAATKYYQQIFDLMRNTFGRCQHILVCAGAGGGTGGGSIPIIIKAAKKYIEFIQAGDPNKNVGVVLTLPTAGELASGSVRMNTKEVLGTIATLAMAKQISPFIIVDNDKIGKLYRGLSPKAFWPTINNTVSGLFDIFNRLAKMSSEFTSFDPVDYRSIMECGGCCIMGLTRIKQLDNETSVSQALATNIEKTLLAGGFDLGTAKFAGSIAVGGSNVMSKAGLQDMLNYGMDTVNNLVGSATLHRGVYESPNPNDADVLKVYTLIGGLEPPKALMNSLGINATELWPGEG